MKPRAAAYAHWVFMQALTTGFALLTLYGLYLMLDWDATGWVKVPVYLVVFVAALFLFIQLMEPIWDKNDALMKRAKEALNKDDDHFPIG